MLQRCISDHRLELKATQQHDTSQVLELQAQRRSDSHIVPWSVDRWTTVEILVKAEVPVKVPHYLDANVRLRAEAQPPRIGQAGENQRARINVHGSETEGRKFQAHKGLTIVPHWLNAGLRKIVFVGIDQTSECEQGRCICLK